MNEMSLINKDLVEAAKKVFDQKEEKDLFVKFEFDDMDFCVTEKNNLGSVDYTQTMGSIDHNGNTLIVYR